MIKHDDLAQWHLIFSSMNLWLVSEPFDVYTILISNKLNQACRYDDAKQEQFIISMSISLSPCFGWTHVENDFDQ